MWGTPQTTKKSHFYNKMCALEQGFCLSSSWGQNGYFYGGIRSESFLGVFRLFLVISGLWKKENKNSCVEVLFWRFETVCWGLRLRSEGENWSNLKGCNPSKKEDLDRPISDTKSHIFTAKRHAFEQGPKGKMLMFFQPGPKWPLL